MWLLIRLLHVGEPDFYCSLAVASHPIGLAEVKRNPFFRTRALLVWMPGQSIEQGDTPLWVTSAVMKDRLAALLFYVSETHSDFVASFLGLLESGLHHINSQMPRPVFGLLRVLLDGTRNIHLGTCKIMQALSNETPNK